MVKKFKLFTLVLFITISFSACSWIGDKSGDNLIILSDNTSKDTGFPVFFGDIEIKSPPLKIASLSPAITEILVEIGFGDRIVLRSEYCDFPKSVEQIPTAGSGANPNIEKILEQKPDVVFTFTPLSDRDFSKLKNNGINLIILKSPQTFESLGNIYSAIGIIIQGNKENANKAKEVFSENFSELTNANLKIGKFAYITTGLRLAGNETFENSFLSKFGQNVLGNQSGYLEKLDLLKENSPEILLVSDEFSLDFIKSYEILKELECVKNGKILFIPNQRFERPSSRLNDVYAVIKM